MKPLFEVLEEMGEDTRFRFELGNTTFELSHAECDGYGAMMKLMRRTAVSFTAPAQRTDAAPPSLLERVRAFVRVVRHRPASPLVLRKHETTWKPGDRVIHRPSAGRVLSADESARVFAAAKTAGVSVNSFLLHALTEAVAPSIAEPSATVTWGVPVNMRGPIRIEPEDANCSSIMPVDVPRGAQPASVHEALVRALRDNLHWGKWDQLNTASRLGRRVLKKKLASYYATAGAARIGVFSNVGVWTGATEPGVGLLAYGVPLLPDPLFAAAITWNGKLGLTLRAHPSLGVDDVTVAEWLKAWLLRLAPAALARDERGAA
jgi:hypothetical protein